jgi:uncharacterized protein
MNSVPHVAALHVYPVKSCAGIALEQARVLPTGLEHDREWMVVDANGAFLTQRELPRLALIGTALDARELTLRVGADCLRLPLRHEGPSREARVWRSRVRAFDAGEAAAQLLSDWLSQEVRLVRFDPRHQRLSNRDWTGALRAPNLFSDGFPVLVASMASLADLNRRLEGPLPMQRFRPNVVLGGVAAWAEDGMHECRGVAGVRLRLVKPCTRCVITTTDQDRGARDGEEPLRTLRGFRSDERVRGVTFGVNAVVVTGGVLHVAEPLQV